MLILTIVGIPNSQKSTQNGFPSFFKPKIALKVNEPSLTLGQTDHKKQFPNYFIQKMALN